MGFAEGSCKGSFKGSSFLVMLHPTVSDLQGLRRHCLIWRDFGLRSIRAVQVFGVYALCL